MSDLTRDSLVEALEAVRLRTCGYSDGKKAAQRCDCKFGLTISRRGSEQNGCPELRFVLALLESLSEKEYEILSKRVF